jgi:anti-sigma factor RsiW
MIMDCKQCRENLTAHLDGELLPDGSAEVRSHLKICSSCADELRSLQKAADFIESHRGELDARPGSWSLVHARISEADSLSPFRFPAMNRWRFALATMALMAAFALSYFWHQQAQKRSLDEYIAQYVKAREAGQSFQILIGKATSSLKAGNLNADNPFIEVKSAFDANPFRSEDR